jgi:hypothetical protein
VLGAPLVGKLTAEQIRFGRVVIPNLTLPKNPGSNLILVTEIEIQLRGVIITQRLSVASNAIYQKKKMTQGWVVNGESPR